MSLFLRLARAAGFALALALAAGAPGPAAAQEEPVEIELVPSRDATLYESATGALADGSGPFLFVGRTGGIVPVAETRRAILAFAIAEEVPAGSVIQGASLTFTVSQGQGPSLAASLHRVTRDWNEGPTVAGGAGGMGGASAVGDVTWIHTFFDGEVWDEAGGDFQATPSVGALIPSSFGSTVTFQGPGLVADLQDMLDAPGSDFGWILKSDDEETRQDAKRLLARAGNSFPPVLAVTYVPEPGAGAALAAGLVALVSLRRIRRA